MVVKTEVSGPQNVDSIKLKLLKTHHLNKSRINDTIKQLVFDNFAKKIHIKTISVSGFILWGKQSYQFPQSSHSSIDSPQNLRKGSAKYYKFKLEQAQEKIKQLENTPLDPSEIPSVFHYNKIKPKKTKNQRITSVHGSMTAKNILKRVKENNKKNEEKELKKKENKEKKLKEGEMFIRCKDKCVCEKPNGKCVTIGLKQCSSCKSVLKSQCGKKACRSPDGAKPFMVKVADSASNKNCNKICVSPDHSSEDVFNDDYDDYESDVF